MEEVWKDIKGYEDLYQVSNYGNVRSLNYNKTGKTRILRTITNNSGYIQVGLHKSGNMKLCTVHRLVAQAFIPNPDNLSIVNHKDYTKTNNTCDNLEWCNYEYNNNYGDRNAKLSNSLTNNIKTSIPILQLDLEGNLIQEFPSVREAARALGKSNLSAASINILKCCRGKADTQYGTVARKTAYGYKWKFKNIN